MNPKFHLGCSWEGYLSYGKIKMLLSWKGGTEPGMQITAELHAQGIVLLETLHTLLCPTAWPHSFGPGEPLSSRMCLVCCPTLCKHTRAAASEGIWGPQGIHRGTSTVSASRFSYSSLVCAFGCSFPSL